MIIDSYNVKASANRSYINFSSTTMEYTSASPPDSDSDDVPVKLDLSKAAKQLIQQQKNAAEHSLSKLNASDSAPVLKSAPAPSDPNELKLVLLEEMLYAMTGKRMKLRAAEIPSINNSQTSRVPLSLNGGNINTQRSAAQQMTFTHLDYESESFTYQAKGVVNTADGKSISIDINFSMSREVISYSSLSLNLNPTCDPLVINYGGTATSLTDEKFDFDLTMDGISEKISFAAEGSGFLAYDKYGDGNIRDGSQLFGPSSGNGFEELSRYDDDGNNWIDEADDIYSKLRVWSKDKDGNDIMYTLKELDIGAIYLGEVATDFSLKGANGDTQGEMRSTSFFLNDNGGAGTVHHIDLVL